MVGVDGDGGGDSTCGGCGGGGVAGHVSVPPPPLSSMRASCNPVSVIHVSNASPSWVRTNVLE